MSNIEYQYYVVEGDGIVKKAIDAYYAAYMAFNAHINVMVDKYGAIGAYAANSIWGLQFDDVGKVPEGWYNKKDHPDNVYTPDVRKKKGKIDAKELRSISKPDWLFLVHSVKSDMIFQERRALVPTFEKLGATMIWKMPLDRKGKSAPLDTTGLRQIKTSEYWSIKENFDVSK